MGQHQSKHLLRAHKVSALVYGAYAIAIPVVYQARMCSLCQNLALAIVDPGLHRLRMCFVRLRIGDPMNFNDVDSHCTQ